MTTAITFAQASSRVQNIVLQPVVEALTTVDRFTRMLPLIPTNGSYQFTMNYEADRGSVDMLAPGGAVTDIVATSTPKTLFAERRVRRFPIPVSSTVQEQSFQTIEAARALGDKVADDVINGTDDHTSFETASLSSYTGVSGTQVVDGNGGALSLTLLDQLILKVKAGSDNMVLVGNAGAQVKIQALLDALGGSSSDMVLNGVIVPRFRGVPFVRTDWIAQDATYHTTDVFAVTLDPAYIGLMVRNADITGANLDSMVQLVRGSLTPAADNLAMQAAVEVNLVIRTPIACARLYDVAVA